MIKGKPMKKLRSRMIECDLEGRDCAEAIGRSEGYWSARIMEREYFSLRDIYILCDLMEIPYEEIPIYFPPISALQKAS